MNYLKNTKAYLSGPIEYDNDGLNWRTKPKEMLTDAFGINLFDPFEDPKQQWVPAIQEAKEKLDYDAMETIARRFVRKDLAMVDRADFIIAYLPYRVPTTGTHHEIIMANDNKKPVLLVCPEGKQHIPLWYRGFIPHQVTFGSWEELYMYLHEVDEGVHKDNNRWAFVYGLL